MKVNKDKLFNKLKHLAIEIGIICIAVYVSYYYGFKIGQNKVIKKAIESKVAEYKVNKERDITLYWIQKNCKSRKKLYIKNQE